MWLGAPFKKAARSSGDKDCDRGMSHPQNKDSPTATSYPLSQPRICHVRILFELFKLGGGRDMGVTCCKSHFDFGRLKIDAKSQMNER